MNVLEVLNIDCVKVPLIARDKHGVIDELVDALAASGAVSDAAAIKQVVWQRESQRSTGIGEGLALPHGKSAAVKRIAMAIGKPGAPMEYDSIDKKPVRLIVLLVSPPECVSEHIQALGRISRLMTNPEFREKLYEAQCAESIYSLFRKAETAE
ncbi:MAG: PTS sugar transporter subunit IIA [Planctomycetes bacterium]|nr:PTS sugar transporter subunit IIA [Planctomycetota bacterium]